MAGFLKRMFGGAEPLPPASLASTDPNGLDLDPVAVAAPADEEAPRGAARASEREEVAEEFARFRAESGLWPLLSPELRAWFDPATREPEPKAILRLALALGDAGRSLDSVAGLALFIEGNWHGGGGCSDRSCDRLEELAGVLRKPIKLYFTATEHSDEYRIARFEAPPFEEPPSVAFAPDPVGPVAAIRALNDHPAYAHFRTVAPAMAMMDPAVSSRLAPLVYGFERGDQRAYVAPAHPRLGKVFVVYGWHRVGVERPVKVAGDLRSALDLLR